MENPIKMDDLEGFQIPLFLVQHPMLVQFPGVPSTSKPPGFVCQEATGSSVELESWWELSREKGGNCWEGNLSEMGGWFPEVCFCLELFHEYLVGGFKYCLCSSLFGEMIQFD